MIIDVFQNFTEEFIRGVASKFILDLEDIHIKQLCDGDAAKMVYLITDRKGRQYILKIAGEYEIEMYEKYLNMRNFLVPEYFGKHECDGKLFIMLSYISGRDLSHFNHHIAVKAAKSIAEIHNAFFTEQRDFVRYQNYMKRIMKRSQSLKNEPVLSQAYQLFLERQKNIPLTLCHGDYLPMNAILHDESIYIVDWGFSGYMPYALDVARMIAHGVENPNENTFPFTMNYKDKEEFLDTYFKLSKVDVSYKEFRRDVMLAMVNEYIEFIESELVKEPEAVKKDLYYKFAMKTACAVLK